MQPLQQRNQHQKHHNANNANHNAHNHLRKYHTQTHAHAQKQCSKHAKQRRADRLPAKLNRRFSLHLAPNANRYQHQYHTDYAADNSLRPL